MDVLGHPTASLEVCGQSPIRTPVITLSGGESAVG